GLHESEAQVRECGEILRPSGNNLFEERQRIASVVGSLQGKGEFVFGVSGGGGERQRMTEYGEGRIVLMICAKRPAKLQGVVEVVFGKLVCLRKFCNSRGRIALVQEDGAEVIVCGCQRGVQRDGTLELHYSRLILLPLRENRAECVVQCRILR